MNLELEETPEGNLGHPSVQKAQCFCAAFAKNGTKLKSLLTPGFNGFNNQGSEVRTVQLYLKILKSWSISESPWNRGFLVASSAKMVPILQMSTGVEYRDAPKSTSGALYHSVTT